MNRSLLSLNNFNITIKNKKFQTAFAVKTCKYLMLDVVKIIEKQSPEVFCEKGALRNFVKF